MKLGIEVHTSDKLCDIPFFTLYFFDARVCFVIKRMHVYYIWLLYLQKKVHILVMVVNLMVV